ncbi:protein-disulfide reductase DsbD family protein [Thalassospira profundimaris]|uniref:protein-disulfide reductase DsbD family protein n=1 Tax=Thalassospira profundimaris TaxID=502049 RepID=UPI00028718AB|nr:protein-disulfide reductase DsbD domain-containing protein [Thalassospira profundimaris]EKF09095.1 Thiol:disulfide interchange protein dsbD 1 precursor [Thalassospira profundimaris WP0211]
MLRHLITRLAFLIAICLSSIGASSVALAASDMATDWVDEDFASVRLISAQTETGGKQTLRLGLEYELQPDWKIYWRSAGDAGFPPQLDWTGSENVGDANILWPAPHRFSIFGLETFGYKDHIILPIDVAIPDPAQPVAIRLDVDYLVCSDICIPANASFDLDIPASASAGAGTSIASNHAHQIEKFVSKVPLRGTGLPIEVTSISSINQGETHSLRLGVRGLDDAGVDIDDILIESDLRAGFGLPEPQTTATGSNEDVQYFDLTVMGLAEDQTLKDQPVTVTVIAGPLSVEQNLVVGDGNAAISTASSAGATAGMSFAMIGLFALLGGLILNVMPCVLPVLSIKIMSALKAREQDINRVRIGFLASAAGIITSFWLIAAVLVGIKLAGGTIGWGIQFQQPLFLTVMTIILALFALNMWGLFEISGPDQLGNAANDAITRSESHGHHISSNFLTGMFATLLATPCSAPFLGTAVGFALAGSVFDIFWIFTLLGIGLALPYFAIAIQPRVAHILPKPGRWMNGVKVVLGLALIGTAIWLLGILSVQIGMGGAIAVGLGLILGCVFIWARKRTSNLRPRFAFTSLAVLGFLVALFAPGFSQPPSSPSASSDNGTLVWQAFAPETIDRLVADGKTVVIDVTAEWCVTCQVNKKLVLEKSDVRNALMQDDVVLMQADWTRPDQKIADYLASYGRFGIPFNAVFGPGAPDGILLSELLGVDEVLGALEDANGSASLASSVQ